ncbi:hypothetical protein C5167_045046 [Papaver somniferum]|uniref:Uncharacterized protein n=1 Tax=Papaver somniferum TaxID=3469 RepID=A0A4Y7LDA5_PAPSO|nr:uncharacterized protein LOC113323160 [Papaver somniferum]RZC82261.1 hypothetical protein C5167_045046 [Papaver somniferum]
MGFLLKRRSGKPTIAKILFVPDSLTLLTIICSSALVNEESKRPLHPPPPQPAWPRVKPQFIPPPPPPPPPPPLPIKDQPNEPPPPLPIKDQPDVPPPLIREGADPMSPPYMCPPIPLVRFDMWLPLFSII